MRKPETLLYGVDDLPPARVGLLAALQQVAFLAALLGVPGLAAARLQMSPEELSSLFGATLFCAGLAVILQGLGRSGVGARLFYPLQCTPAAIPALLYAGDVGLGLAGAFTMVAVTGAAQVLFSFLVVRLRGIVTVEVAGLAVFLIGVGLGQQGLLLIFGAGVGPDMALVQAGVAGLTFAVLILLHVYVRSRLRLFTNLIGLSVGLAAGAALGLVEPGAITAFRGAAWISVPSLPVFGWDFRPEVAIPFAVTGFFFALISVGVQTIAQRNNDRDWRAPDLLSISRGIRAEGVVHMLGGLMNALPMVASGGAVTLATASGVTSRALAYWTGGLLILLSFTPKLVGVWSMIPEAVTGALFLFLATFTTVNGVQLVASRVLDARKVLAIGTGFVTAIAYEPLHALVEGRLPQIRLFTFSSFAASVLVTVLMLAVFRIGARREVTRRFPAHEASHNEVAEFLEAEGGRWGARVDVVQRGAHVAWQAIDLVGQELVDPAKPFIEVTTRYDDLVFDVVLRYEGEPPVLPSRPPTAEALMEDPALATQLTGYLITRLTPDFRMQRAGTAWELHFRLPV